MKKILFILLLLPVLAIGQTDTINYVKTVTYRQPTLTTNENSAQVGITYFDGLGRPIQQIASKASPTNKDIITHIEYDQYSRQPKQYLPYTVTSATSLYDPAAKQHTEQFYNAGKYENTLNPFSQSFYEPSPLNRVLKQASPGNSWEGNPDVYNSNDHTIKIDFQTNKAREVRKFKAIFDDENNTEAPKLICTGHYSLNQLYKTITKDENWTSADGKCKTTEEFKDKLGRLILKRTYVKNTLNQDDPLDTYYVYDRYSNLTYVIPPLAAPQIIIEVPELTIGTINYPWVDLVKAGQFITDSYKAAITGYNNADILNLNLINDFGGQGGFSVSTNPTGNLILNINIATSVPYEYNNGIILSLDSLGEFDDKEIGRITGAGYEYIFYITNNAIVVTGNGYVPSIVKTLDSSQRLEYNKNYPWTDICIADAGVASRYVKDIENLDNSDILTTYTPNDYGAKGGLSITLSDDDNLTVSLNITADVDMQLLSGAAFTLDVQRPLNDMTLGTVSGNGYSYEFEVLSNVLYVRGSGKFRAINFQGSRVPFLNAMIKHEVENLCYIYHYDKRNRVIEKHIPDNGWTSIVYDQRNRPVHMQDQKQRTSVLTGNDGGRPYNYTLWSFTEYDEFDRPALTGLFEDISGDANSRLTYQAQQNSLVLNSTLFSKKREAIPFPYGGILVYYTPTDNITPTDKSWPKLLTVNYYDDYLPFESENMVPEPINMLGATITSTAKGLATGSKVSILGTSSWITSVTGYDDKSRPVWATTSNPYLGTEDRTETLPNFTGEVSRSVRKHMKTGVDPITLYETFSYDRMGRLITHLQAQNPLWGWDIGPESNLIASNEYDELGQLIRKKVGNDVQSPYQSIDYSYNIRGWLKQINNPQALNNDLFAFKIGYDNLYNGNISSTQSKTVIDEGLKSYNYTYDAINRLINADYFEDIVTTTPNKYKEGGIEYDRNGNIIRLSRNGYRENTTFGLIDNLSYIYKPVSNQLLQVIDNSGHLEGFTDSNNDGNDYDYDANGNMVKDMNKNVGRVAGEEIVYNHLNLPTDIIIDTDHKIKYVYDATGQKIEKQVTNGAGIITTTEYAQGFIYENNVLQYFSHPEGYVRRETNGDFTYVYQYKDHLGNVRLSYADSNGDGVIADAGYNEGFENEGGWNYYYLATVSRDSSKKHNGNYSGKLINNNPGEEVYCISEYMMPINNSVATSYTFSGWYYSEGPSIDFFLYMYTDATNVTFDYIGSSTATGTWQYIEKQVIVPATIKYFRFRVDNNANGTVWFDDLSIKRTDGATEIIEETDYYPFGMQHTGDNNAVTSTNIGQKIKYNGKELQDELGLNIYDYGARNYDPAIGRWFNIDPLAKNHYENSPFMYANNNPVIFVDPDGMDFTLTGAAAQSFVAGLQRAMSEAEATDSELSIDANEEPPVNLFQPTSIDSHQKVFNDAFNEANKKGNYKIGDNVFNVYGHGAIGAIWDNKSGGDFKISSAKAFDKMMSEKSSAYKEALRTNKAFVLFLNSCNSATEEEGYRSLARKISSEHKTSTIVGFEGYAFYGVDKNGNPAIIGVSSKIGYNDNKGKIVTYKDGEIYNSVLYMDYLKNQKL